MVLIFPITCKLYILLYKWPKCPLKILVHRIHLYWIAFILYQATEMSYEHSRFQCVSYGQKLSMSKVNSLQDLYYMWIATSHNRRDMPYKPWLINLDTKVES